MGAKVCHTFWHCRLKSCLITVTNTETEKRTYLQNIIIHKRKCEILVQEFQYKNIKNWRYEDRLVV
ncbi:hypothetical protein BpHYR1_013997 [Brachionus plicatilis]|uniref:Uncharacterized protein n=1 Tax=Brachionus plicatilis TaxID=10195 RepID=A0A3M7SSS6_BRAPC|nr:hypothetical protein BpHYR1_013997 [Brachionus plicatilis]